MKPSSTITSFRRVRLCRVMSGLVALVMAAAPYGAAADSAIVDGRADPAQATQYGAGAFVTSLGEKVIAILNAHPETDKEARASALDRIFKTSFDVTGMARFAAGVYWRRTAPAERDKYVDLFGKYVSHLYAARFAHYKGQKFVIAALRPSGDGVTAVRTLIVSDDNQTPIEFRLRRSGPDYRIVDVYVGGVSLLITKRDEFNAVLAREGMEGLMQRLKATASGVG